MRTMTRTLRGAVAAVALLVSIPVGVEAQRTVYPGGPWVSDVRGSGGASQITGTNPRNGNRSLELSVSSNLADWGWFNLFRATRRPRRGGGSSRS
jgi:hypothetical protein